MMHDRSAPDCRGEHGFTLIEMLVSITILMIVSGTVMRGVLALTDVSRTVSNRTDMHNGVRNATELLTQEVGQAGRIALPGRVTLNAAAATGSTALVVTSTAEDAATVATVGMFANMLLLVGIGDTQETVKVSTVAGNTVNLSAPLKNNHAPAVPVLAVGGFGQGVVPPADEGFANGSTPNVLKIFGDIHDDGRMVYVEYTCDLPNNRLYRRSVPYNAATKGTPSVEEILIDNIEENPVDQAGNETPCFRYQTEKIVDDLYVVDVAITLTIYTQHRDKNTGDFQRETKALLNVSPRNVFNVWQAASLNMTDRMQPMPPEVALLLPAAGTAAAGVEQ